MPASNVIRKDPRAIGDDVLAIVSALVDELGGRPGARPVGLDDRLDRDLGVGSLERVELLLRLEQRFGVRLPDAVMAEAVSPRDLVAAIRRSEPAGLEALPRIQPSLGEAAPPPVEARSLAEVLAWHAEATPERVHVFLRDEEGREQPITYGALWHRARAVAAGLRDRRVGRGDTVAIMLRTEAAFFDTFFGVLLAGSVPVPVYPPFRRDLIEDYARRQVGILDNAGARAIVTFPEAARVATLLRSRVPSVRHTVLATDLGRAEPGAVLTAGPDEPALIQYTSGSTGAPKGVLLSHANLLANIRAIGDAIRIRPDDVAVSWLPLYHDMGLIGSWLGALYFGIPIAILSPLAFLARPARWLHAIHAHRGTVSAAPNFGFDLCARRITDEEIQGLDLSSWRLALNGSEPVSPETIARFGRRFGPWGFRARAMCPVYGLAEASVALTIPAPGQGPRVDTVAREPFQQAGRAEPASAGEPAPLCFVSCGPPLPRHQARVVDRDGHPLGEREEGRIEFCGPSVTAGYWRNPTATRAARRDGWMDSGDLGYWADGELFITGRVKDLIKKAGRNLYPQEVEDLVGGIPGIRKGCVAAFGVHDPSVGTERLVVVAETRQREAAERERLRAAVMDRVVAALGVPADVVVVADPHAVLKTSSGKVRRSATRAAYLEGVVGRPGRSVAAQWARLLLGTVGARVRRAAGRLPALARGTYLGSLLLLTLPPLWALVRVAPTGRTADRTVRLWCRLILALSGCALRLEGEERLAAVTGPVVLAANHASYLDVVVLLAALPLPFRFVAKHELARTPLVGTVIRKVGHLTVERGRASQSVADAERVTRALRDGLSVLVFPEGTFARPPGILPFRLGGFKAAVDTGRPVVPVTVRGAREILPAYAWLPQPGPVTVAVGAPIMAEEDGWRAMVELRDRTRAEISRRSGEPAVNRSYTS
ncbi:MAG TPA: AMP-binding protein [Methylomirabilota bacterium]|nr:AMP-binding protein [Methylomirabilota bacterium]